jgi:hypothetical protein
MKRTDRMRDDSGLQMQVEPGRGSTRPMVARMLLLGWLLVACGGRVAGSDGSRPADADVSQGGSNDPGANPLAGSGGQGSGGQASAAQTTGGQLTWNAFDTPDLSKPYVSTSRPGPRDTSTYCSTTELVGTLDGEPIDQLYDFGGGGCNVGEDWLVALSLLGWGEATLLGPSLPSTALDLLLPGTTVNAHRGRLSLPHFLPHSDQFVCVLNGSIERGVGWMGLHFDSIGFLPPCSQGTAVEGSLDLSLGDASDHSLTGTLDGQTIERTLWQMSGSSYWFEGTADNLEFRVLFEALTPTTANLLENWIVDSATGIVYCAGPASFADAIVIKGSVGSRYQQSIHFRDLRRVGDCSDAAGTDWLTAFSCEVCW